jgi:aminoglycoside phosphotransferase (APT) family kinase protein
MSKLPKRIQEQLAQADALLSAANPAQVEVVAPTPIEPTPVPVAPVPAEPAAQAPAPTPAVSADPEEKWEARYKTLQGMHNRNMEDMKARQRAIEQQNQELAAQLAALKAAPAPSASPDPKYAETFGQDLVDMVRGVAEEMFGAAAKQIDARMGAIEQKLTGTTQAVTQTAEELFLARLNEAVPDYLEINSNPDFLAWLAEAREGLINDEWSGLPI